MNEVGDKRYKLTDYIFLFTIIFLLCVPAFFSGGRNFYIQEVISLLVAASTIFLLKDNKILKKNKCLYLSILIFIVLSFVSSFLSISIRNSLIYSANYLTYFLVFLISSIYKFNKKEITKIFEIFLLSGLLVSGVGFYYFFTQYFSRITSTFYWPNPFAGYLLFIIPISLYLFFLNNSKLGIISFFVSILALIFTGSRGAFLSLGISFIFLFLAYFLGKKDKRLEIYNSLKKTLHYNIKSVILFSLSALFVFILILTCKDNNFLNRYHDNQQTLDFSSSIRLNYWQGAIDIFKAHPLLGSGPDTFSIIYPEFQKNILSSGKYAHNWLLEILSENGLIGLMFFLVFLYLIYRNYFKKKSYFLNSFLFVGITASVLHNLLDFDWHFWENSYIFYFLLGLSINYSLDSYLSENKEIEATSDNLAIKASAETHFPIKKIGLLIVIIIIFKSSLLIYENFNFLNATEIGDIGQKSTAELYFKKSVRFNNPEYLRGYLQYLISIDSQNSWNKTDEIFSLLLKVDNNFAYNHFLRGKAMFLKGDYSTAAKNFKRAIELDKVNYPEFYYFLALSYLKQGRITEAKNLLLTSISYYTPEILNDKKYIITNNQKLETEISKKASLLYLMLANVYFNENNLVEASKFSNLALQIDPGDKTIK